MLGVNIWLHCISYCTYVAFSCFLKRTFGPIRAAVHVLRSGIDNGAVSIRPTFVYLQKTATSYRTAFTSRYVRASVVVYIAFHVHRV